MQLIGQPHFASHSLQIAIPRQQQLPIQRLEQFRPPLRPVGGRDQLQDRMRRKPRFTVLQDQGQRRRRFRDQLNHAKPDRIARKRLFGQRNRVSRAPGHAAGVQMRHQTTRRRGLDLGRRLRIPRLSFAPQKIKYHA